MRGTAYGILYKQLPGQAKPWIRLHVYRLAVSLKENLRVYEIISILTCYGHATEHITLVFLDSMGNAHIMLQNTIHIDVEPRT